MPATVIYAMRFKIAEINQTKRNKVLLYSYCPTDICHIPYICTYMYINNNVIRRWDPTVNSLAPLTKGFGSVSFVDAVFVWPHLIRAGAREMQKEREREAERVLHFAINSQRIKRNRRPWMKGRATERSERESEEWEGEGRLTTNNARSIRKFCALGTHKYKGQKIETGCLKNVNKGSAADGDGDGDGSDGSRFRTQIRIARNDVVLVSPCALPLLSPCVHACSTCRLLSSLTGQKCENCELTVVAWCS